MLKQRILIIAGLVLTFTMPIAGPATADVCEKVDGITGECIVSVPSPGGGGGGGTTDGSNKPSDKVPECKNTLTGLEVPCSKDGAGAWSNRLQCYVQVLSPQPPKSDPVWEGNTTGAIYQCTDALVAGSYLVWMSQPPATVTPEQVAQMAIARLQIKAGNPSITPGGPGSESVIGLPTYLWIDSPSAQTWGPATASASAGGITVNVRAQVSSVTWNMGDGAVVECTSPGTPYAVEFEDRPSPDCGHTYTRAGAFAVTATSHWTIDWVGGGASGQERLDLSSTTSTQIREIQVLVN